MACKVFGTPELVHTVVEELEFDHNSLAHLACVSKTFHHISIKYLWAGTEEPAPKDTLHRLMGVFPEGLFLEQPWGRWMKRVFEESDLIRLAHYSVHCRCLALEAARYSEGLLTYLGHRRERLFPHLNTLLVTENDPMVHTGARWMLLAGPLLGRLEVNVPPEGWGRGLDDPFHHPDDEAAFHSFTEQLIPRVPNLVHLDITDFITPLSHTQAAHFSSIILSLTKLRTLCIRSQGTLSRDILSTLTHPTISELILDSVNPSQGFEEPTVRFPSLRALTLAGDSAAMATCLPIIAPIHLLSELNLNISDIDNIHPLIPLFPIAHNLTTLGLVISEVRSWEALRPLLICELLCDLSISGEAPMVGPYDQDLEDLAVSLPLLEHLYIVSVNREMQYEATLYGLAPLAKYCHQLQALTLQLTTRVTNGDDGMPQVDETNDLFRSLTLVMPDINIEDDTPDFLGPRQIATFLASLWPSLGPSGMLLTRGESRSELEPDHDLEIPGYIETWDEMLAFMGDLERCRDSYQETIEDLERENSSLREKLAEMEKELDKCGKYHMRSG